MAAEKAILGPKRIGPLMFVRSMTNPRDVLNEMVRKYGDPFVVTMPEGPYVISGHPDAARAVFTADHDAFDVPLRDKLGPFFGETSLILTSGARHKKDRALLMPPFHGARMRAYGTTIRRIAEDAAAAWKPGKPFEMLHATQAISLEVILRAVFGVDDDEQRARFREAILRLMRAMASPLIVMFEYWRRDFGGLGPWARFQRASRALDALLYEEIDRRRDSEAREDILSLLLSARYEDESGMSREELRDQLHLLLFAGHETTATALAWAFYWIHRQPAVRERLLADLDALGADPEPEAIASLPYLEAICKETLRIHPVAAEVARLLRKPLDVRGYTVPAGSMVSLSIMLLHDNEELYPEPRTFRPERFLERKFTPFELIPFGGGARRCLGAAFAMYEMKLVLATLVRKQRLRLVSDKPVRCVRRGVTMGPKGGIPMLVE